MIVSELASRARYLSALTKKLAAYLEKMPEGRLRISTVRGKRYYYLCADPGDQHGRYLRRCDAVLVQKLAQKHYVKKVQRRAAAELRLIQKTLDGIGLPPEDIYGSMPEAFRELVVPIEPTDEQYVKKWTERGAAEANGHPIEADLITDKGERVRSKSELIIANLLYSAGIPYKYEAPLFLDGIGTVYPDFTILNVRLRREIYWEHQGRMDDPAYAEKAVARIAVYMKNGYFPGDGLILTSETAKNGLSVSVVRAIIEKYCV